MALPKRLHGNEKWWAQLDHLDAAVDAFGGVDIAVNTVGKVLRKPIVETTEAEYDSMFGINSKAAAPKARSSTSRVQRPRNSPIAGINVNTTR